MLPKLITLTILVFRYPALFNPDSKNELWKEFCRLDAALNLFSFNLTQCLATLDEIRLPEFDGVRTLNDIFGSKIVHYGFYRDAPVVLKRLVDHDRLQRLEREICDKATPENCDIRTLPRSDLKRALIEMFSDGNRIEGCIVCPFSVDAVERVRKRVGMGDEINFWTLLAVNVHPLMLKVFEGRDLVPELFHSFGFSTIESNAGVPLIDFYENDLRDRLVIAQRLIEIGLALEEGFEGLRFYLTDLSFDNVAVDAETLGVAIVDLDNVIVVDSGAGNLLETHIHEKIDCENCFAYSIEDICRHRSSDLNLFAVCQLLREDLKGDPDGGLLHGVPKDREDFLELQKLLDRCVDCQATENCDRKELSSRMLQKISEILKNFK